jgi:putative phosphoribosyl transferase
MPELFDDRYQAGELLAQRLLPYSGPACIVLAIPRGGVPVGYEVSKALACPLDVIVPRKLPIPWNPEAGFGAVMPDGTRVLNDEMVARLGLAPQRIEDITRGVVREVRRRELAYRKDRPHPRLSGQTVILVDDGLATGYTMRAAVEALRKQTPAAVVVAVPVAPRNTAEEIERVADEVVVLHIVEEYPFAVASFYGSFPDLSDAEVKRLLTEREKALERVVDQVA